MSEQYNNLEQKLNSLIEKFNSIEIKIRKFDEVINILQNKNIIQIKDVDSDSDDLLCNNNFCNNDYVSECKICREDYCNEHIKRIYYKKDYYYNMGKSIESYFYKSICSICLIQNNYNKNKILYLLKDYDYSKIPITSISNKDNFFYNFKKID